MEIKTVKSRSVNDLTCLYKCEFCGFEDEAYGYADNYFFTEVVPSIVCKECDKNTTGTNKRI